MVEAHGDGGQTHIGLDVGAAGVSTGEVGDDRAVVMAMQVAVGADDASGCGGEGGCAGDGHGASAATAAGSGRAACLGSRRVDAAARSTDVCGAVAADRQELRAGVRP